MVSQQPALNDNNLALCDAIAKTIATSPGGRITFAEYMDLVLYHPEQGYYATKAINIGPQGDFFTSPHLGADFGELLAEQFYQIWQILGNPSPFSLVEMGAGQGVLAADIMQYLQKQHLDFFAALEYVIVEKSDALKQEQQRRLAEFSIRWCDLEAIPNNSIIGCFFSNELVDAFPVHQVVIEAGELREIYVIASQNNFIEVTDIPSTKQLAEYFDLVQIQLPSPKYEEGYRTEVNLAALDWLSAITNKLNRGYLLTIDYGYSAERYYNPLRRQGTLQCYYRHRHHDNPYLHIGQQDITAHVDFTALERWGELCGLHKLGFTQQGLFLMALGLGDRIAALSSTHETGNQAIQQIWRRHDALHQLINPMGLGGFGVLIQTKGLTQEEKAYPLKGLSELT
jgi:SAM-dependent MidA family methyltransferase